MSEFEEFSWRSITEFIRHFSFLFIGALVIAVIVTDNSFFDIVEMALDHQGFSGVFCAIIECVKKSL